MTAAPDVEYAEKAVVGSVLMAPALVRELSGLVSPDDFLDAQLGALFNLIAGLVSAGGPEAVTPVTVAREARDRKKVESKGRLDGVRYPDWNTITGLVTFQAIGAVTTHAKSVREAGLSRNLAALGRRITVDAEMGWDPALLAARAVEDARRIRDGYRTTGLPFECLSDVLDDESLGEYDWVIPGLLERNDRLIITGGEGLGKSTYMRQLALCAAAGIHPFTAAPIPRMKVVVVDAENSRRQWHRKARGVNIAVSRLAGVRASDLVQLVCVSRKDITNPRDFADFHAALDEHTPDLMVIGPLYKLVPNAINNDSEAAPLINALDSLRERGVTLVMEAHAGKGLHAGGDRNFAPRGSAALLGWPEFGFGLAPDPTDEGVVHALRWRGDRDERDWPTRLRRGGVMPWTCDKTEPGRDAASLRLAASNGEWTPTSALGGSA